MWVFACVCGFGAQTTFAQLHHYACVTLATIRSQKATLPPAKLGRWKDPPQSIPDSASLACTELPISWSGATGLSGCTQVWMYIGL